MGIDIPPDGSAVPPDFVIAQRAKLNHIENHAKRLGLSEEEFDLYGRYKAKVSLLKSLLMASSAPLYNARRLHGAATLSQLSLAG